MKIYRKYIKYKQCYGGVAQPAEQRTHNPIFLFIKCNKNKY